MIFSGGKYTESTGALIALHSAFGSSQRMQLFDARRAPDQHEIRKGILDDIRDFHREDVARGVFRPFAVFEEVRPQSRIRNGLRLSRRDRQVELPVRCPHTMRIETLRLRDILAAGQERRRERLRISKSASRVCGGCIWPRSMTAARLARR